MHTTVNERKGLRYGGMPHSALLKKMAVTRAPEDEDEDPADVTNAYIRSEIIDRSPDPPAMESDTIRRDPGFSKRLLNLRHNGTPGSRPELPRHPEMFYGFTDNDPRGAGTDPRFDKMRAHLATRAANLEVSMGNNDDNAINESPWTGQSISFALKHVLKQVRKNTKIFTAQREGKPTGRNVAFNQLIAGENLRRQAKEGTEGLGDGGSTKQVRFAGGDHAAASESKTGAMRRVDRRADADTALWRNSEGDTDFGVQGVAAREGRRPGAVPDTGRALRQAKQDGDLGVQRYAAPVGRQGQLSQQKNTGGAAVRGTAGDQSLATQIAGAYVPRTVLAANISLALKTASSRKLARGDTDLGKQGIAAKLGRAAAPATAA